MFAEFVKAQAVLLGARPGMTESAPGGVDTRNQRVPRSGSFQIGQPDTPEDSSFLLGVRSGVTMPDDRNDREDMHAGVRADDGLEFSDRPETILRASLVKLGEELAVAFDSDSARDDVEYDRARYIHGLRAFSDFLRANGAPLRYAQLWNQLAVALMDLNDGKTDELLAPSSFGSVNAGATTAEWVGRANAALGMATLVAVGNTRRQAAQHAERATGIASSRLVSWYDEFRKPIEKSKTTNGLARALFDNALPLTSLQNAHEAQKLADHFFGLAAARLQKQT
jgi:hypothetical protein